MSIRRWFQVAVVTLALSGAVAPMFSHSDAQVTTGTNGTTTDTDRRGTDYGWLGLLGLVGLAGLMGGNRREDRTMSRNTSSTAGARP